MRAFVLLALALCSCRAETRETAVENTVEQINAAGERAATAAVTVVGTAGPAAFTPAGAAVAAAIVADPIVTPLVIKPMEAAASGIEATGRALTPRERSEAMLRFERSKSVAKTRRAIRDLYADKTARSAAPLAAELIAGLEPGAAGAKEFVSEFAADPSVAVREASAAKLREIEKLAAAR